MSEFKTIIDIIVELEEYKKFFRKKIFEIYLHEYVDIKDIENLYNQICNNEEYEEALLLENQEYDILIFTQEEKEFPITDLISEINKMFLMIISM